MTFRYERLAAADDEGGNRHKKEAHQNGNNSTARAIKLLGDSVSVMTSH